MGINLNRSSSRSNQPISEINVTPFVDVMLVLLIVFMVTAPMLTVGVPVNLPETNADSLPDDNEPLTVSINAKGEIFIKDSSPDFFPQKLVSINGFDSLETVGTTANEISGFQLNQMNRLLLLMVLKK